MRETYGPLMLSPPGYPFPEKVEQTHWAGKDLGLTTFSASSCIQLDRYSWHDGECHLACTYRNIILIIIIYKLVPVHSRITCSGSLMRAQVTLCMTQPAMVMI
jgi:hypothetical protein